MCFCEIKIFGPLGFGKKFGDIPLVTECTLKYQKYFDIQTSIHSDIGWIIYSYTCEGNFDIKIT